jgi:hypothetical protein
VDRRQQADTEHVGEDTQPGLEARKTQADRRRRQQPRRLAQQRERDADPRQQQVEGEQHADARVDADREDAGEVKSPKPFFSASSRTATYDPAKPIPAMITAPKTTTPMRTRCAQVSSGV